MSYYGYHDNVGIVMVPVFPYTPIPMGGDLIMLMVIMALLQNLPSRRGNADVGRNLGLNPFPNKPWFLCVCSKILLKTLWEKKKLLVTSNFSFSHSVFYPFRELSAILIKVEVVVCKLFQFGRV